MRILKLDLPGRLHALGPDLQLDDPAVQARLYPELDKISGELGDRIRFKAKAYLPRGYTLFSRVAFEPDGHRVRVTMWIDDPTVTGFAGLLARRAWQLSVPIMAHIVREAAQERLQTLAIEIDEEKSRVFAFAPSRAWSNPIILGAGVVVLVSLYWLVLNDWVASALRHMAGR